MTIEKTRPPAGKPAPARPPIVDAHVHVYDSAANRHAFLEQEDPTMRALIGDYAALPRRYTIEDYLRDAAACEVRGIICHEYLSQDPVAEMRWLQQRADAAPVPVAIVALVDFLDKGLGERLEAYRGLPAITAVRQHLGWDAANPLRRFAARGDLLDDPAWRRGVSQLAATGYRCGLEVFAPQLPAMLQVVRANAQIGFTLALFGWPIDTSPEGFASWRQSLDALCRCDNVCLSISGTECIFAMAWETATLRDWLLAAIERFGPRRCMFGSHLPISRLSRGFTPLYAAYLEIIESFSADEQAAMLGTVAADWFSLPAMPEKR